MNYWRVKQSEFSLNFFLLTFFNLNIFKVSKFNYLPATLFDNESKLQLQEFIYPVKAIKSVMVVHTIFFKHKTKREERMKKPNLVFHLISYHLQRILTIQKQAFIDGNLGLDVASLVHLRLGVLNVQQEQSNLLVANRYLSVTPLHFGKSHRLLLSSLRNQVLKENG